MKHVRNTDSGWYNIMLIFITTIADIVEAGGTDSDEDGLVDNFTDTDNVFTILMIQIMEEIQ